MYCFCKGFQGLWVNFSIYQFIHRLEHHSLHHFLTRRNHFTINFSVNSSFDLRKFVLILTPYNSYRSTFFTCTTCSTRTVCINFNIVWKLVMYYVSYIIYINSSGSYIRCYKNGNIFCFKLLHHSVSLNLRHVSVQPTCIVTVCLQTFRYTLSFCTSTTKNNSINIRVRINQTSQYFITNTIVN